MTATDDLRLLLDERGVEHTDGYDLTEWLDEQGRTVIATDSVAKCRLNDRKMVVRRVMTPEQAIAATLGNDGVERSKNGVSERGTCHKLPQESNLVCEVHNGHFTASFGYWTCSECRCENFEGAKYCMNCGAEVVE